VPISVRIFGDAGDVETWQAILSRPTYQMAVDETRGTDPETDEEGLFGHMKILQPAWLRLGRAVLTPVFRIKALPR
jgi:hypothetical protein